MFQIKEKSNKQKIAELKKDTYKCMYKRDKKKNLNVDIYQYMQNPFDETIKFNVIVKELTAEKQLDNLKKKSERDK